MATAIAAIDITRAEQIHGWMARDELVYLASKASVSSRVIEIGSYKGRSSRAIADNLSPGATLTCIDQWHPYESSSSVVHTQIEGDIIYHEFLNNLKDKIDNLTVAVIRSPSQRVVDCITKPADMIFIDGNHDYDAVKVDIETWSDKVKSGGILCGHDYRIMDGVTKAVDEIFGSRVVNPVGSIWEVRL